MAEWTYWAGKRVSLEQTLELILRHHVVWRKMKTENSRQRVGNVSRLEPGNRLHLAYRARGRAQYLLTATIAQPLHPVQGAPGIDLISGESAAELGRAGYPLLENGQVEVFQLENVHLIDARPYVVPPRNQLTLTKGPPVLEREAPRARVREATSEPPVVAGAKTTPLFDRYIAVDWSASSVPVMGADSIWIGVGEWRRGVLEISTLNYGTRGSAIDHVRMLLATPGRTLLGFDFAFGYPRGFAQALQLEGSAWEAVMNYLDEQIVDDAATNANNRAGVASMINNDLGGGPGPFWGCHGNQASPTLTTNRIGHFAFPYHGLHEYRATDRRARAARTIPQSVWKLNQGVSVGGQTLVGIPHLRRLIQGGQNQKSTPNLVLWPFETGWTLPAQGSVCVEIFPSVVAPKVPSDVIRDEYQVIQCVRTFARLDATAQLAQRFEEPAELTEADELAARREEGWIFLVE